MTTVPSSKKKVPNRGLPLTEEIQESIYPNNYEENIAEGGEFLDDALRMHDQPLGETTAEENE